MFFKKVEEFKKVVREMQIDDIRIPDERVRRIAHDENLASLADSIARHGIIEPVLVREAPSHDSSLPTRILVAGERRIRAARACGMTTVPAIVIAATQTEAAVLAIIENLHREDLNIFEEAFAIRSLIELGGMTQEACAARLSVSQSYVANKLRLLRLTPTEQELILQNGLSERHARALLRFPDAEMRTEILRVFIERQLNVAAAEEYVEALLCADARAAEMESRPEKSEGRRRLIIKDIRLFYNSIDHAVDVIKRSGIAVSSTRRETDDGVLIEILLPKHAG
ncbi:MAG: ParB/RepB/Spo0J family partition protein [Ruminococcaceae bacterium]|nr:ParB/RepB/Spo0J family partition protein [Oscillospiraceae bacterium]